MKLKSIITNNNEITQATSLYWEKGIPKLLKVEKGIPFTDLVRK